MRRTLAVPLPLALAASALLLFRAQGGTRPVFPHDKHAEAGVECATCHAGAAESKNLKTSLVPRIDVCQGCHEQTDLKSWGFRRVPERKSGFRRFSHQKHLAAGMSCETCHGAMAHAEQAAKGKGMIGHPLCMQCHDGIRQSNDCQDCHSSLREGRLNGMERDPSIMKPMDHHPGFLHDHQFAARLDGSKCRDCHRQENFCSDCHQGEDAVFMTHERNWLYTHPVAARKNLSECAGCHDLNSYCTECHADRGIRPGSHAAAGWIGSLHAEAARRDIEQCASCHDAENAFVCARCHKDTGGRGDQPTMNIHPSDFRTTVGHGYWHDDPNAACFQCHNQGARQAGVGFCGYCHGPKH